MSIEAYLQLVVPEHRGAPKFIATLAALLQPLLDQQALLATMNEAFDLDEAVGAQLDVVGQWVGRSRFIAVPLPNVFFSFGVAGLGFGQGYWKGLYDSTSGLTRLDDDSYRLLLRAKIGANQWDGTQASAAAILATVFTDPASLVFMQDNGDMTITIAVAGQPLDVVQFALLTEGYLPLRPMGVRIAYVDQTSVPGSPIFGFGVQSPRVSGFGSGAWSA